MQCISVSVKMALISHLSIHAQATNSLEKSTDEAHLHSENTQESLKIKSVH